MTPYFPIILFVFAVAIMALIHARYSVIEDLRRPWTTLLAIQERPKTLFFFALAFIASCVAFFILLHGSPFIDLQSVSPSRWQSINEVDHLMQEWKVNGWSHFEGGGVPVGYFNSNLDELLTIFLSTLTFGLLDFQQSSAIFVVLTILLRGSAGFLFSLRAFGFAPAVLSSLLIVFSTDASILSSHEWAFDCAIALFIFSLSTIKDLWTSPNQKTFFMFSFLSGLSLLFHPVSLALISLVAFTSLLSYFFTQQVSFAIFRRSIFRFLSAVSLALLISASFILPLVSLSQGAQDSHFVWQEISKIGSLLFKLELYQGQFKIVTIFGIAALLILPISNKFWPFFVSSTCLLSFVFFSSNVFLWLPWLNEVPFLRELRLHNTSVFTQTLFLISASYLVAKFFKTIFPLTDLVKIESGRVKSLVRISLVAAAVVAISHEAIDFSRYTQSEPKTEVLDRDYNQVIQWIKRNSRKSTGYPDRTAAWPLSTKSKLSDLAWQLNQPIYMMGQAPSDDFKNIPYSTSNKLITHLNTRFVISETRKLGRSQYKLKKKIGRYRIYENRKWKKGKPYRIIQGSGTISKIRFSRDKITFTASSNSSGSAMFFVTYFPAWTLKVDQEDTALGHEPFLGIRNTDFMTFELVPGKYTLEFGDTWQDIVGKILSVLGLSLLALIVLVKKIAFRFL
ncbi:hypothetical protein N9D31_01945 [Oligoflexaceae bacterium]|nr:hypothetical protein [Oligoflexaceae bacterium]